MAVEQTVEKASGSRFVLLAALLSLAIVSAAAFGRVFQGARPTLQLIGAAAVAMLLAGAFERRHVLLATAVSAAGLAIAIGLLVFHSTTWFGLPTLTTVRTAVRAWHAIGQIAATEVAPTPPFAPLFVAALTAVWAASFSTHALASRARSPMLALLPPAGLVAFTSIILDEGARPLYVLIFLTSAIAVLFADGLRRVGQWGPITVWQGRRRFGSATTRGARWVAAVTIGVAVLLPGILPGYRGQGLVRVHGTPSTVHVAINPIVQIRPYLRMADAIPLFTVRASESTYWRFLTLDRFNGKIWSASNLMAEGGSQVIDGDLRPSADLDPSEARTVTQHFQFLRLSQRWLPAANQPVSFDGQVPIRYDPDSSALVVPGGTSTGFSYDVTSLEVIPREKDLDGVTELNAPGSSGFTELPSGMPHLAEITAIARRITQDGRNPYRKILALQNWLRSPRNFTYSDQVTGGHGADDILNFLTKTKTGYCEQFAGSMAVMLRALGIPARVAVGFTPGIVQTQRSHTTVLRVTTQQAHAWVEVLFPRYGWLAFEPTPSRFNAQTAPYAFPLPPASGLPGGNTPSECRRPLGAGPFAEPCIGQPSSNPTPPGETRREPGGAKSSGTSAGQGGGLSARALGWLAALAVVLLLVVGIPMTKAVRRRVALRRAKEPAELVLASMNVLDERAGDVGLGRQRAETLQEYGRRLVDSVHGLDGQMTGLVVLAGRAAYSMDDISGAHAEQARTAAGRATKLIRGSVGLDRRILGAYKLRRTRRFPRATG